MGGGDDELTVEHAAMRESREEGLVHFGKVTIERTLITALNEDLAWAAAEHDRTKAVPFRLVKESATNRDLLRQLCQHRLDRRRHSSCAGALRCRHLISLRMREYRHCGQKPRCEL